MRIAATATHRIVLGAGWITLGVLAIAVVVLLAALVHRAVQPSTVIVRCAATGAAVIAEPAAADAPRDEKAVRFFLERFLSASFEAERKNASPSFEKMVSPAFTHAASAAWRPPQWPDEALRVVARVHRLTLSGNPVPGTSLQVMGTGEVLFTPAARFEAADASEAPVPIFFQATLLVEPFSERIPYGLLVHWLEARFFESEDLLKVFLDKAEVP